MDLDVCWGQGEETAIFMPSKPCYIFHIYIVFRIINMMKKAIDIWNTQKYVMQYCYAITFLLKIQIIIRYQYGAWSASLAAGFG